MVARSAGWGGPRPSYPPPLSTIYTEVNGFFVLNTLGGNDIINAGSSTLQMLIFGGFGNDNITGGTADNVIFGDNGLAQYMSLGSAPAVAAQFGTAGDGDFFDNLVHCLTVARTTNATLNQDGADTIRVPSNTSNLGVLPASICQK
jgi:Ca2+-binding RTX toxin-like protein